jgi:hypothetical protein
MKSVLKIAEKIKALRGKGALVIIPIVLLGILAIAAFLAFLGAALIFGLNLMGLSIPYTFSTITGAVIVLSMIKPVGDSKK